MLVPREEEYLHRIAEVTMCHWPQTRSAVGLLSWTAETFPSHREKPQRTLLIRLLTRGKVRQYVGSAPDRRGTL